MKSLLRSTSLFVLALMLGLGALPSNAHAADLPYKWFLVHVVFHPDQSKTVGITVTVNGQDLTRAGDGSTLTTTGGGSFDPDSKQADGTGQYTIKDGAGKVTSQGSYQVTGFVSWQQLPGGFPPGFKVDGDGAAPPGMAPSSGILKLNVKLDKLGDGVMVVNCKLPTTPGAAGLEEGVVLTVGNFNFTEIVHTEKTAPSDERTVFFVPASKAMTAPAPTTAPTTGTDLPPSATALILGAFALLIMGAGLALRRRRA
jgi:MYXO-CTERM domain-containing protein